MYNKFLEIKPTKTGKGVFTKVFIPAKSVIMEVTGDIHMVDANSANNSWIQISHQHFIGFSGRADDQIRHSCDPNCYLSVVGKRAILYSLYQIRADSELTFDYSTTSTDTLQSWSMQCKCGTGKCRKVISGFQYLPEEVLQDYKQKGILPLFIVDPRFKGS